MSDIDAKKDSLKTEVPENLLKHTEEFQKQSNMNYFSKT